MGGIRRMIVSLLRSAGTGGMLGGFRIDERGSLIEEDMADEEEWTEAAYLPDKNWRDEQGNSMSNYIGEDQKEMEERDCGTQPQERKNAVSAGDFRNTAQRGGT